MPQSFEELRSLLEKAEYQVQTRNNYIIELTDRVTELEFWNEHLLNLDVERKDAVELAVAKGVAEIKQKNTYISMLKLKLKQTEKRLYAEVAKLKKKNEPIQKKDCSIKELNKKVIELDLKIKGINDKTILRHYMRVC
ncbi:hypothetical protein K3495_g12658 [Podosphaera aphanis]|nr:hypothetical protein K3495_g12658 [Podosphaera aphanis]